MSSTLRWTGSCCSFFGVAMPAAGSCPTCPRRRRKRQKLFTLDSLRPAELLRLMAQQLGEVGADRGLIER